ncbi:hypothetical protein QL285_072707 [Trifolium repens]|nr:hypothetical protein QL285_072707 [Trifolium repens]
MVYNEKANVDSKFDVVADIVPDKGNVHIKAQKSLYMDPLIIETFCSHCPFSTPSKSMEFVNDLIVTPPTSHVKDDIESDIPTAFKRNLSKVFDIVSKCHQCSFEKGED